MSHALRRAGVLAVATAALVAGAWLAGPIRNPIPTVLTGTPLDGDGGGGGDGSGDAPGDQDRASRDHPRKPATPSGTPDGAARSASPSAPATEKPPERKAPTGDAATEERVIALANRHRSAGGCGPVKLDTRLRTAARAHSADMAAKNYFSHTGADGSSPWDRAKRAGYSSPSGENIAMGQRSAEAVMQAWMNSDGHRKNILNCDSKAIGVGLRRNASGTPYWTQLFGFV